jgi:hypothetical protein
MFNWIKKRFAAPTTLTITQEDIDAGKKNFATRGARAKTCTVANAARREIGSKIMVTSYSIAKFGGLIPVDFELSKELCEIVSLNDAGAFDQIKTGTYQIQKI